MTLESTFALIAAVALIATGYMFRVIVDDWQPRRRLPREQTVRDVLRGRR